MMSNVLNKFKCRRTFSLEKNIHKYRFEDINMVDLFLANNTASDNCFEIRNQETLTTKLLKEMW